MMAPKSNEAPLKLWVFVDHESEEMAHSLYAIDLPSDLPSEVEQEREVDYQELSPCICFPKRICLPDPAMVNLGPHLYFLGGFTGDMKPRERRLLHATPVRVVDTNNPEQGARLVASMNAPKEKHCVFVADDMIYALGRADEDTDERWTESGSGLFERYVPGLNKWQVLPDPPLPWDVLATADWTGRATVVGREVFIATHARHFIGDHACHLIFNLDTLEWAEASPDFPYGALYVDPFLYHIRGLGEQPWISGAVWDPDYVSDPPHIVRRGPFSKCGASHSIGKCILESALLEPKKSQVLFTAAELAGEGEYFFTHDNFEPWRELIHLGGPYFCFFVTALNTSYKPQPYDDHNRLIGIMIFKELQGEDKNTECRLVSSSFYRIHTQFSNWGQVIRCRALGSVPESWNRVVPSKKQESWIRVKKNEVDMVATQHGNRLLGFNAGSKESKIENHDCVGEIGNLKKLLAAQEEKLRTLYSELAKKDEILKTYEGGVTDKQEI